MSKQRLNKKDGIAPVASGNWGCGSTSHGDVQLKLVIQWMAASLAGLPVLVYYTSGHEKLTKVQFIPGAQHQVDSELEFSTENRANVLI